MTIDAVSGAWWLQYAKDFTSGVRPRKLVCEKGAYHGQSDWY